MAAKNATVACPAGEWTELTDSGGASGEVSVALLGGASVWLQATASGGAAPTSEAGVLTLIKPGDGWSGATIAAKFPGVASAVRLYAKPVGGTASRMGISHA